MGEVERLDDYRPHVQGECLCARCKHTWRAVTPAGVADNLECPECGGRHGFLRNPCEPANDPVWECNCGCQVFYATPNGIYCWGCGVAQNIHE